MQILKNERIKAVIDENGILKELYDLEGGQSNLVDINGHTGAALFTLKTDSITELPCDGLSPYAERMSEDDGSITRSTSYELNDKGLTINLSAKSENISAFGLMLDLQFLDKKGEEVYDQLLPTSPYTSEDGRFMYCIFTRPNGRFAVAVARTPAVGWKLKYSPYQCGHYIFNLQFMSSFDRYYGETGIHEMSVTLNVASTVEEAYRLIGDICEVPYAIPVISGGFDGLSVIEVSDGADALEIKDPDGEIRTLPVTNSVMTVAIPKFGKSFITPIKKGVKGINAVVWNGKDFDRAMSMTAASQKEPYHGDHNLCEGGFFMWNYIRYMMKKGSHEYDEIVRRELKTVTAQTEPYVHRKTIAPSQDGYAPYHIFNSNRIQEQFTGVSILLEAYKLYKDQIYIDFAVKALNELIDNWITPEGMITNGVDYTTVTCPVLTIVDMALFFKDKDKALYGKYADTAVRVADHVVRRGFDFPTEGAKSEQKMQTEDGSISCSALTVFYVAKFIKRKPEYIEFGERVLKLHEAWKIYAPDVRMYCSSFRWWETIWEGDSDGPAICAGHAWTIWRSESLFHLGVLTHNSEAMVDSWNGFLTNYSKMDEMGNMYSCYLPDYLCGGGSLGVRRDLLNITEETLPKRYGIVHGYPSAKDSSLSRYAWVRSYDTWLRTAAVIDMKGETLYIRCHMDGDTLVFDEHITDLYLDTEKDVSSRLCRDDVTVI